MSQQLSYDMHVTSAAVLARNMRSFTEQDPQALQEPAFSLS